MANFKIYPNIAKQAECSTAEWKIENEIANWELLFAGLLLLNATEAEY